MHSNLVSRNAAAKKVTSFPHAYSNKLDVCSRGRYPPLTEETYPLKNAVTERPG